MDYIYIYIFVLFVCIYLIHVKFDFVKCKNMLDTRNGAAEQGGRMLVYTV